MQTYMVISFICDDRPGIVERLSELVSHHEGNWLESRMSNLAGKFAGIIRVALPRSQAEALGAALRELDAVGLTLALQAAEQALAQEALVPFRLDILGHDRPGIVHEFASALARRRINVFDMRSDITSAPMSADPLFTARAEIHVPQQLDLDELRESLESIAEELLIEYSLERIG